MIRNGIGNETSSALTGADELEEDVEYAAHDLGAETLGPEVQLVLRQQVKQDGEATAALR